MTSIEWGWAVAAAVACASIAVVPASRRARDICLCAVVVCVSVAYGGYARTAALSSTLAMWCADQAALRGDARAETPIEVQGHLERDASPGANGGASLAIAVERVRVSGAWRELSGRVQATVTGTPPPAFLDRCVAGRLVVAPVLLRELQELRNPGGASPLWTALRRSADLAGSIKSASLVDVQPGPPWSELTARIRQYVRRAVTDAIAPRSPQSAGIVTAILIGDRTGLDDETQRRLQIAGTYHVIAISGGNIAILTTLCLVVFRLLIRSWRTVSLLTLVIVAGYGVVVGSQPSVERAVVAASIYLALGLAGLRTPALPTFFVVGAVVAVIDPLAVVDVSAWLSFGATLGIIVGATRAVQFATHIRVPRGVLDRIWLAALGLLAATCTAELALAPVAAAVFARVTVAGLLLNFIAIPAMTLAAVAGFALVLLHGWWGSAAHVAAMAADYSARALVDSSRLVDLVPELAWRTPPTWAGWSAVYYGAACAALVMRGWRWPRRAAVIVAAVCLAIIVTAPGMESAGPPTGWLRLTMIDVGQGDALLVQFPTHQSLLVDAGGVPGTFDIGGRVVAPALWALGVRRLDWLAVTHDDNDHIGGAKSVLRDLSPREVWEGVPVLRNANWLALRLAAAARGVVWRSMRSGQVEQVGSVLMQVLNPPEPDWERQKARNDDSMVLRLRFGDVELVLTGDMGQEVEDRWPDETGAPPIRILKVPHHGSRSASSPHLLELVRPSLALVSVGAANLFGHPAPDVMARYTAIGADIFRTDQDGAVIVETNGAVVNVRTMSGRRFTVRVSRTW